VRDTDYQQPFKVAHASTFEPLIVKPARASSGVKPNSTQAIFIMISGETERLEPGLQSVETAMGTPASH